jgi:hypothetical protein
VLGTAAATRLSAHPPDNKKVKEGKMVPLRSSALEGGEWSASRPGRALPPGKEPPVPFVQEVGWAPEPVWTQRLEEKSSTFVGDRAPAVQSVVKHYTD